jgi:ribonuclease P protein component
MSTTSLTRARDFSRVHTEGRRARSDGVAIVAAPAGDPLATPRLGLAVGRAAGSAVVRNRIKRRIRAVWRRAEPPLGFDVVVRPSPATAEMPFQDLEEHLKLALTRATTPRARA